MNKRPRSVTLIGWLFIAVGIHGFAYHAGGVAPFDYDLVWVLFVRLLAIVGGVFLLRGANWARWLLLIWMAYHVILGTLHSLSELIVHVVLFAGITYAFRRPKASQYFRRERSEL